MIICVPGDRGVATVIILYFCNFYRFVTQATWTLRLCSCGSVSELLNDKGKVSLALWHVYFEKMIKRNVLSSLFNTESSVTIIIIFPLTVVPYTRTKRLYPWSTHH